MSRAKPFPVLIARIEAAVPGSEPVSVVLATNMLSVGVDIRRLTLMLVNGQPKLTSEYIQATSRVGRGAIPGLVIACYSPTKPRDRSHYETFYAYHQSLYRHVEPSSVTPFSLPARQRALHAALVILVRHGLGLCGKDAAGQILRPDVDLDSACQAILDRVALVDSDELEATRAQLERLVDEWKRLATAEAAAGRPLYYDHNAPKTHARLLRAYGSPEPGWRPSTRCETSISNVPSGSRGRGADMRRTIRLSQTLAPFGVGAVYDFLGESFVACDSYRWGNHGVRLRPAGLDKALGVKELRSAPTASFGTHSGSLPFYRFPQWLFCPRCRRMTRWSTKMEQPNQPATCPACGKGGRKPPQLAPMRFVLVCEDGHLSDIPWPRWAHSLAGDNHKQRQCQSKDLVF